MGYQPIVLCRTCGEPLDVYEAWEDRFCCEECFDEYCEAESIAASHFVTD